MLQIFKGAQGIYKEYETQESTRKWLFFLCRNLQQYECKMHKHQCICCHRAKRCEFDAVNSADVI